MALNVDDDEGTHAQHVQKRVSGANWVRSDCCGRGRFGLAIKGERVSGNILKQRPEKDHTQKREQTQTEKHTNNTQTPRRQMEPRYTHSHPDIERNGAAAKNIVTYRNLYFSRTLTPFSFMVFG